MPGEGDSSDVLVIGGGPAGSTIAALLSEKGWRVTILEKDRHPRFHIGESLLPSNMQIFERLGIMPSMEQIGVVKRGLDFTLPSDDAYVPFSFSGIDNLPFGTTFQVRRSDFDHMLLRNAEAKGATVHEEVEAVSFEFGGHRPVRVRGVDGAGTEREWTAEFLIDASGRDTFLADRLRFKEKNPRHASAAIYAHFTGAERRPGDEAGNISIYWFDHGWMWMIPLQNDTMSVGAAVWPRYLKTRVKPIEQFFMDTIARCPPLAKRLRHAEISTPVTATGNYSYFSRRMYGEHYLLVGDSYGFIDPVFSSGVYLAMYGAMLGADAVDGFFRDSARKTALLDHQEKVLRRGIDRLSWFIYRFTTPALQNMFMNPKKFLNIEEDVTALLAGDVFHNRRWSPSLIAFKGIYHLLTITNPKWRQTSDVHGADAYKAPEAIAGE